MVNPRQAWTAFRAHVLNRWAGRDGGNLVRGLILFGFVLALTVALPGHMSTDSVVQLAEGRAGSQRSFNPAFMSWFLGVLDGVLSGTALFVLVNIGLLFVSLSLMTRLTARVRLIAAPVVLIIVMTPQVLIYQGIVWKDVFFANAAIAAFVSLAWAARRWGDPRARRLPWLIALILFVVAALIRQNGVLALMAGSVAIGLVSLCQAGGLRTGWRPALLALGLLLASGGVLMVGATLALDRAIPQNNPNSKTAGFRIIQHYDLIGVLALDPKAHLGPIEAFNPASAETMRSVAPQVYTPERVDRLGDAAALGPALWSTPNTTMMAAWQGVVVEDFPTYARHRLAVFRQVFLTPTLSACLPLHTGVQGPADILAELRISPRQDDRDVELSNYGSQFFATPLYSHLTFGLVSIAVVGLLLFRRSATDWIMCGLQISALAFAGSFLLIALACDYRYLYYLDLSALVGVLYIALDPPKLGIARRFQSKSGTSE